MGVVAVPIINVYMFIDIYKGPQGNIAYMLIVTHSQNNVYINKNCSYRQNAYRILDECSCSKEAAVV